VLLAFDADARRNHHVAHGLQALAALVKEAGFIVHLELWDESHGKGIDDLLAKGKVQRVFTGEELLATPKPPHSLMGDAVDPIAVH
jgi:hypothetical protein